MNRIIERKCILRIYSLLFTIILINPLLNNFISNTTILRGCELICLFIVLYYEICLYRFNGLKYITRNMYPLFILLLFISLGIIVRGDWPSSIKDIGLHLLYPTLIYLIPFFILPLPNYRYFRDIIFLFFKISLWVIPIWLLNLSDLIQTGPTAYMTERIGEFLPFFCAFFLGLLSFFSKKQKYVIFLLWGIFFILMLLNARRNVSFSLALYAFIAYLFSIWSELKKNPIKFVLIILGSILAIQVLLLNFEKLTIGTFKNMAGRASEDTRSGVEEIFFLDFMNSPIEDWIWGRGLDGAYAQTVVNAETGEISDSRSVIETGYLHMMMKGGIVYDLLILSFLIIASRKALNQRDNNLKYIGFILLTYLIDMYSTNPVCDYSVRSILFWFIVSLCMQTALYTSKQCYK